MTATTLPDEDNDDPDDQDLPPEPDTEGDIPDVITDPAEE